MTVMDRGVEVKLVDISKSFGGVLAVDNFSLTIEASEFLTLLGPSGSGKTTTLMLIAGFEIPTSGDVLVDGRLVTNMPPYWRDLGIVFQNYALFPHMTVYENLAFPLTTRKVKRTEIDSRVREALNLVRLPGLESRLPNQLSGGQQQRVALARAIVYNPSVLLMDEPLGALDKKLREQMQLEIKHIQRELHITVIYVTHDQEEALTMSDRIVVMNQGKIVQVGLPEEIYERPVDRFVADFIGESNFLEARILSCDQHSIKAETDGGVILFLPTNYSISIEKRVVVAVRPERIAIATSNQLREPVSGLEHKRQWLDGVIDEIVYVGEMRKYRVRIQDHFLLVKQPSGTDVSSYAEGEAVKIGWYQNDLKIVSQHPAEKGGT